MYGLNHIFQWSISLSSSFLIDTSMSTTKTSNPNNKVTIFKIYFLLLFAIFTWISLLNLF